MPTDEKRLSEVQMVHLTVPPGYCTFPRMKLDRTPPKASSKALQAGPQARIGAALRKAIDLRVKDGLTILEAAKRAGLSEAGYHKAMKRPAVLEHYQNVQAQYIQEVEALKAGYKARAYAVAADLMENAKSEQVRMRAVEFFAGGPSAPTVNVQVNNAPAGYTYARPVDQASAADGAQPVEIEGKASEV